MAYQDWKNIVTTGSPLDLDHSGDFDCVDVDLSLAQYLWPDLPYRETIGDSNAKDLWKVANPNYFEILEYKPGMALQQMDILVCDATPASGFTNTFPNPYGHTGVLDRWDSSTYTLIEQASDTGQAPHEGTRPWNYRPITHVLRPKVNKGDDMVQESDKDLWEYLSKFARGRYDPNTQNLNALGDDEFEKAADGQSWPDALNTLFRDPEATDCLETLRLGRLASHDNWEQQIHDRDTWIKQLKAEMASTDKPAEDKLKAIQAIINQ